MASLTDPRPRTSGCILFDWGNTLMRDFPDVRGPMAAWPQVEVMPHVVEALAAVRPRWTLALATNADDSDEPEIWAALRRVGLDKLLDAIYCSRRIGHRKPSSAFFTCILQELRMPPSQVVMVGDDFETDVLGANRAGLRAIWFNDRTDEVRIGTLYRTIHDLRSLPSALDELAQANSLTAR
jgi:putative hydrolase of the HAD superfamily